MTAWLRLADDQRRRTLEQAFILSGMTAKAIEKDWWVTLSLKALFGSQHAQYVIFKGGTSLSKGWKLIERFSEDIDIALDPQAFGMEYLQNPSHSYVKKLKKEGCAFTSTVIKEALEARFMELGLANESVQIEVATVPETIPDRDPQTLFIRYQSLYEPHPYLADEIKMEFGVRSLKEPFSTIQVRSILSEVFPNPAYEKTPFPVVVVEPRKTFLEKMFLLHEKFTQDRGMLGDRQSRHIYDLVQMMNAGIDQTALEDVDLYARLLEHRKYYVRLRGIDYETLHYPKISFVPPLALMETFQQDYAAMQTAMIYGASPDFDVLIGQLRTLNERFNQLGGSRLN